MQIKTYYQIDFIDEVGLANYIETYHNEEKALNDLKVLEHARQCLSTETKYVLDLYAYIENDDGHPVENTDVLIYKNINRS